MEKAIWQMQQEAEQRVRRMQERSRRLMEEQNHRSAASLYAARTAAEAVREPYRTAWRPQEPHPPHPAPAPPPPAPEDDRERLFLLLLSVFLKENGAGTLLVLMLLYLAA
mgnify:FL=1